MGGTGEGVSALLGWGDRVREGARLLEAETVGTLGAETMGTLGAETMGILGAETVGTLGAGFKFLTIAFFFLPTKGPGDSVFKLLHSLCVCTHVHISKGHCY